MTTNQPAGPDSPAGDPFTIGSNPTPELSPAERALQKVLDVVHGLAGMKQSDFVLSPYPAPEAPVLTAADIKIGKSYVVGKNPHYADGEPCIRLKEGDVGRARRVDSNGDVRLVDKQGKFLGYIAPECLTRAPEAPVNANGISQDILNFVEAYERLTEMERVKREAPESRDRYAQCDTTCTTDCGACKGRRFGPHAQAMTEHPTAVDANGDPIRPGARYNVGQGPYYVGTNGAPYAASIRSGEVVEAMCPFGSQRRNFKVRTTQGWEGVVANSCLTPAPDETSDTVKVGDRVTVGPNPTWASGMRCSMLKGGETGYVKRIDNNQDAHLYVKLDAPIAGSEFLGICHVRHLTVTPEPTPEATPVEPDTSRIELGDRHPDTGMVLLGINGNKVWGAEDYETAAHHDDYIEDARLSASGQQLHAALAVMRRAFDQAEKKGVDVFADGTVIARGWLATPDDRNAPPTIRARIYLAREVQTLVDAGKPLTGLSYEVRDHRTPMKRCSNCEPETPGTHDPSCAVAPKTTPTADTDDDLLRRVGAAAFTERWSDDMLIRSARTFLASEPMRELLARTAREARETAERELARTQLERNRLNYNYEASKAEVERLTGELAELRALNEQKARALRQSADDWRRMADGDLHPEGSVVFAPGDPMHDVAQIVRDLPETTASRAGGLIRTSRGEVWDEESDELLATEASVRLAVLALRARERAAEAGRAADPTEDEMDEQVCELGGHIMDAVSGYEGEAFAIGNAVLNLVETFQDAHRAARADKTNTEETR